MNTEKYLVKEKKKLNLYEVPTSYHGKLEKKEVKEVLIPENIKKPSTFNCPSSYGCSRKRFLNKKHYDGSKPTGDKGCIL